MSNVCTCEPKTVTHLSAKDRQPTVGKTANGLTRINTFTVDVLLPVFTFSKLWKTGLCVSENFSHCQNDSQSFAYFEKSYGNLTCFQSIPFYSTSCIFTEYAFKTFLEFFSKRNKIVQNVLLNRAFDAVNFFTKIGIYRKCIDAKLCHVFRWAQAQR